MPRLAAATLALVAVAVATDAVARASAPPVGPLPPGPTATLATKTGELVAVALPHRSGGRSWRIARAFDSSVLRQVSEADVGSNVVLVFKAIGPGKTTLTFALTRGETATALGSRRFVVRVQDA